MARKQNPYSWPKLKRLRYVTRRVVSLTSILAQLALASRGKERQQTFNKLCSFMLEAGGVYTKFLQGVLLGVPEVQRWVKDQHVDFFENVPTEALDVGEILNRELSEGVARLAINPEVLASGTFAQVYAGVLDFDKHVIIKVQRQTIRPSLKVDIWLLKWFVRYGKPFLTSLDTDIGTMSRDFARITWAEIDYEREMRLGEVLRERVMATHPKLVVPRTYDISTKHVLIQDRLGGTSVASLLSHTTPLTASQRQALQEMTRVLLMLPFTTGLIHADPHPGNIRLMDDGRIALLDFGAIDDKLVDIDIYKRLLGATIKAMDGTITAVEALDAYFATYAPRLYRAIEVTTRALGVQPVLPMLARASLGQEAADSPQQVFKGDLLALADINKLVNPNNCFALRSSLQNVSYARAIQTVMHTMQLLGLKTEIVAALRTIQNDLALMPREQSKNVSDIPSASEAKEIVYNWLEKVLERNPLMVSELLGLFGALKSAIPALPNKRS